MQKTLLQSKECLQLARSYPSLCHIELSSWQNELLHIQWMSDYCLRTSGIQNVCMYMYARHGLSSVDVRTNVFSPTMTIATQSRLLWSGIRLYRKETNCYRDNETQVVGDMTEESACLNIH